MSMFGLEAEIELVYAPLKFDDYSLRVPPIFSTQLDPAYSLSLPNSLDNCSSLQWLELPVDEASMGVRS
jgi:hypothetical protein